MIYALSSVLILGPVILGVVLHKRHVEMRAQERLCKCIIGGKPCSQRTIRRHQMIIPSHSRDRVGTFTKKFRTVTFDVCTEHEKHVRLMNAGYKHFTLLELAWRHITDPHQFITDETLFARAGAIPYTQPDLSARMDAMTEKNLHRGTIHQPDGAHVVRHTR